MPGRHLGTDSDVGPGSACLLLVACVFLASSRSRQLGLLPARASRGGPEVAVLFGSVASDRSGTRPRERSGKRLPETLPRAWRRLASASASR